MFSQSDDRFNASAFFSPLTFQGELIDQQVQSFKAVLLNMCQPDLHKLHILRLTTQKVVENAFFSYSFML